MVYKSPMVLTGRLSSFTMRIPPITAIREPGIFLLIKGQIIKIARLTTPTKTDIQLIVEINSATALIFSIVSMVTVPSA